MFKKIEALIKEALKAEAPEDLDRHDVKLASAALLIHCAKSDGVKSADEDQLLSDILMQRFELSPAETQSLLDEAEAREADAVDAYGFARVLHKNLDRDERLEFVRLLWQLTHADNTIDHNEQSTVMLVAHLLHVEVHEAVALRQSVSKPGEA